MRHARLSDPHHNCNAAYSTCNELRSPACDTMLQGIDLSWWEKLKAARLSPRSGFKLGKLQVCHEE